MAHFKEATLPGPGGGKIIINVDQIRVMHWTPDTTTIRSTSPPPAAAPAKGTG